MSDRVTALTEAERATLVIKLAQIQSELDLAGEALAAVHISHALDCIGRDNPGACSYSMLQAANAR